MAGAACSPSAPCARGLLRIRLLCIGLSILLALAPMLAAAQSDSGEDADDTPPAPWTRSVVCPILYTHEIVSQPVFRRFLVGMLSAGYHPISLETLDAEMVGTQNPVSKCLVLTFDDSLLSQYQNAVPVLSDVGVPAVFFVLPGFADGVHRYMGTPQLQAIAAAGFDVDLHTCNHANLPLLARRNLMAMFAELEDCRHILEDIIDEPVDYLAYPSGAYDATVLDAVNRFGFRAAFTTRASAVLNYRTPFTLPRIRYDPSEAPATVIARIKAAGG
jgi:peptidoglycan/xylan/chitin deacetylase (PgdA/CDA1 family)